MDGLAPITPPPDSERHFVAKRLRHEPETVRIRAFELYMQGQPVREIAKELGCSYQYVYKLARYNDWPGRRLKIASAAVLQEDARVEDALNRAVETLRAKLDERLKGLDALCTHTSPKIRLAAIRTWVTLAGLGKTALEEFVGGRAAFVEVHNDLSDRRQVTVVQGPQAALPEGEVHDVAPV